MTAVLTAVTGLVAVTVAVTVAPKPAHAASGWNLLLNQWTGGILQGRTNALGSGIIQKHWDPTVQPTQGQQWMFTTDDGGPIRSGSVVTFRNAGTSAWYGLAISGARTDQGAPAILWTYEGSHTEQQWVAHTGTVGGTFTLTNVKSAKCLAISHASTDDDVTAVQWPCNGGLEQLWFVVPV